MGIQNGTKGTAVDGGVKVDVAGFEGVLYGYYGKGVGTTGLYILATSAAGNERKSDGGYAQLTYKIDRLKLGVSYGVSELKLASDEQGTTGVDRHLRQRSRASQRVRRLRGVLQPDEEPDVGG